MLGAAYTIPLFITVSSCMTIGLGIMGYKNYIANQIKTINKQNINILPYNLLMILKIKIIKELF